MPVFPRSSATYKTNDTKLAIVPLAQGFAVLPATFEVRSAKWQRALQFCHTLIYLPIARLMSMVLTLATSHFD